MLYLLTAAIVFGLEAVFYTYVHVKFAALFATLIGSPLVMLIVLVNVGSDATGTLESSGLRWERIIERGWAIIVLDVAIALAGALALAGMASGDVGNKLVGVLLLFWTAVLVYAEPFAALETNVQTLTIVPFSILRSMMLAWVNMPRILSLLAIQIILEIGAMGLEALTAHSGTHASDLASLAYGVFVTTPLAALFAVAYLDTLAQEKHLLQR
jgi:hypothetical protein